MSGEGTSGRKILHIDMDCFYAAIECRDDPSIADQPVGVGGRERRGVLTTCNYEARKYGCRSAMPVYQALERCPHLVLRPVRFEVYRRESRRIRKIFGEYTDLVEPLSLDEAYLDVSGQRRYAWEVAREIRRRIREETGLTASAGVAPNKMLAKVASDWRKPDGQFAILPGQVDSFMKSLALRRIPGVGPRAEALLEEQGIHNCGELQAVSPGQLSQWFGAARALELWERCRGRDDRPVESQRERKSLSVERTYGHDLVSWESCVGQLDRLLAELREDYEKLSGTPPFRKVFVKLKFTNFRQTTCERRGDKLEREVFVELLRTAHGRSPHAVRLMGVGIRFPEAVEGEQLEFTFPLPKSDLI